MTKTVTRYFCQSPCALPDSLHGPGNFVRYEDYERLQKLIRRVVEWEPTFPVECTLLEELNAAANGLPAEPVERHVTTVGGLEQFLAHKTSKTGLDTSETLLPCPFCGQEAAFTDGLRRGQSDNYTVAAACINTSCGVRTPEHYQDRASAAAAWNRRAVNRPGEPSGEHPLKQYCTCPAPGKSNRTINPTCPVAFPHPWSS